MIGDVEFAYDSEKSISKMDTPVVKSATAKEKTVM